VAKTCTVTETNVGVASVIVVQISGTVVGPFGQINEGIVWCKIFLFQGGIGCAEASGVVQTFLKHGTDIIFALGQRNGPPTKQGRQGMKGGFTFASTTGWASNAVPIVVVAGRVIEVLRVATIGGGGPRWFGAGCLFYVGFFAFDDACFAALLATGVLVLVGWAVGTSAIAGTVGA
jgi:hypothetical protein